MPDSSVSPNRMKRKKRVVAIVQARMGSARFPGKVMKEIAGKPMLELLVERVRRCRNINEVVIATGASPANLPIVNLSERIGCASFVGSEDDLLDRYYQAAKRYSADIIVRITGDCPLHDPHIIDTAVDFYLKSEEQFDYVSNVDPPSFPDGFDLWVFPFKILEKAWKEARLPSEREHVCPYIWKNPQIFKIGRVSSPVDYSALRWTVDTPLDFEFVRAVYEHLYEEGEVFTMEDILRFAKTHPEYDKRDAREERDEGYRRSVMNDRKDSNRLKS